VKRGELYRVAHPSARDPKKHRVFVIVSRQVLIDSRFSTLVCAPIYSSHEGLFTQVPVGVDEGLKHDSSIHCDELISLSKSAFTDYVGMLSPTKLNELNEALRMALDLPDSI
jgi:mRNA interferase MazF